MEARARRQEFRGSTNLLGDHDESDYWEVNHNDAPDRHRSRAFSHRHEAGRRGQRGSLREFGSYEPQDRINSRTISQHRHEVDILRYIFLAYMSLSHSFIFYDLPSRSFLSD